MSLEATADPYWHTVPLLLISFFEAPVAILALCAPAIGQMGTQILQHPTYASLLSIFSTRKSKYKFGSKEGGGTHQARQVVEYDDDKSQSNYSVTPAAKSPIHVQQIQNGPPAVPAVVAQRTTSAHQVQRRSDDSQESSAPIVPVEAAAITQGVAVTHYQHNSQWPDQYRYAGTTTYWDVESSR